MKKLILCLSILFLTACSNNEVKKPVKKPIAVQSTQKDIVQVKEGVYLDTTFKVDSVKRKPTSISVLKKSNSWKVSPGTDLKTVLESWADQSNWSLAWEAGLSKKIIFKNKNDIYLTANSYPAAVKKLFSSLSLHKKGWYYRSYSENSMMRVYLK